MEVEAGEVFISPIVIECVAQRTWLYAKNLGEGV